MSKRSKNSSIVDHEFRHFGVERGNLFDPALEGQHLVGDIERHHDDRHAGFHHDVGGFRIDIDVEFGSRRDVAALEKAAAHHHEFLDTLWQMSGAF